MLKAIHHSGVLPPPAAVRRAAACIASAALSRTDVQDDDYAGPGLGLRRLRVGLRLLRRPESPAEARESEPDSAGGAKPCH